MKNAMKNRLRAGGNTIGCWLFSGSVASAEILSNCGFDALIFDHEHSPGGIDTALGQLRAIGPSESTALVRLGDCSTAAIKRVLDLGAEGIVIPNAEDPEEIARLVAGAHYPPAGTRGAHFTVSRAARWGLDGDRYAANASDELLVIAMIESAAGVAAIPDLAAIGGIDLLFIGPLDLSASIGCMGNYADPAFVEILGEAERRTNEAGVMLAGSTMPGHSVSELFARGYRFVTPISDVALLRDGGRAQVQSFRELGG